MRTFKNDYKLTAADSKRIQCSAPDCDDHATTGQNNGGAPFGYFCDFHAEMGRQTGKYFASKS